MPTIFNFSDISLRITAIRETFEELGVLICKHKEQLDDSSLYSNLLHNNFDVAHWQRQVSTDLPLQTIEYTLLHCTRAEFYQLHISFNHLGSQRRIQFLEIVRRAECGARSVVSKRMVSLADTNFQKR